jgi:outer membrane protein
MVRSFSRRPLLACALLVLTAPLASAQVKVAIVDLQRAVLETAEIKKASADLEAKYKPRQAELEKIEKELLEIQQKLQAGAGKLTPQEEGDLTAQGQRRQREMQRTGEDLQADVNRERTDILGGASRRMQEAIQKMAEEKGLDIVLERTNALYVRSTLDLTNEAIAAYDKAHPPK